MRVKRPKNIIVKFLYFVTGVMMVLIGLFGLVMPVIPGFILLIPGLYLLSCVSLTFHTWIKKNRFIGKYFAENEA